VKGRSDLPYFGKEIRVRTVGLVVLLLAQPLPKPPRSNRWELSAS
jgi:hypothetical protein